jgi:hypothetical protein
MYYLKTGDVGVRDKQPLFSEYVNSYRLILFGIDEDCPITNSMKKLHCSLETWSFVLSAKGANVTSISWMSDQDLRHKG